METSFYIIKPDGLMMCKEIRAAIENGGLIIAESKNLVLPRWALETIYSDLEERYRSAVFHQFEKVSVETGIVIGEDAVKKLLHTTGTERDPVDCAEHTIRFKFGAKKPIIVGGVRCYQNVIHRSRDRNEAAKDIAVYQKLQNSAPET